MVTFLTFEQRQVKLQRNNKSTIDSSVIILENIIIRLKEATEKFYPIYKLFALHKVLAQILCPEDAEVNQTFCHKFLIVFQLILSNPAHNTKGQVYDLLHNWLKHGLLTSSGFKWQTRRKILTPAFHFNILQQYVQVFNEEADELVSILKQECRKSYVNITAHTTQFTLKTIAGKNSS